MLPFVVLVDDVAVTNTCFVNFSDFSLFNTIMALRKLGLFELDVLASGDPSVLRKVQNVCRYCGFNFWTHQVAYMMGAAWRIKHEFMGLVPRKPIDLLTFYGVSRKVTMLTLQDAFPKEKRYRGVVMDRHVAVYCRVMGLTKETDLDLMAQDVEGYLAERFYLPLNEGAAGIRQLWRNKANHKIIMAAATKCDCLGVLKLITKDVVAVNKSELLSLDPNMVEGLEVTTARLEKGRAARAAAQAAKAVKMEEDVVMEEEEDVVSEYHII